jgi:hypothetical protein
VIRLAPEPAPEQKDGMPRSERALLAVTALALGGPARLRPLYRILDAAAAWLARRLGRAYGRAEVLLGADATLAAVAAAAARLASAPGVRAVDVFLNVHGQPATVTLAGGEVEVPALAAALAGGTAVGAVAGGAAASGAPMGGARPRLVYSTACHAAAHAAALRAAGFRACVGARRINATGGFETPVFLALWARGAEVGRALRIADHPAPRGLADAVAGLVLRAVGERGAVDSGKVLEGEAGVSIES